MYVGTGITLSNPPIHNDRGNEQPAAGYPEGSSIEPGRLLPVQANETLTPMQCAHAKGMGYFPDACPTAVEDSRAYSGRNSAAETCWDRNDMMNPGTKFHMLHIPKTAMCSVMTDILDIIPRDKIYSQEDCYVDTTQSDAETMVFLRQPRTHVMSQFFQCTTSDDWPFPHPNLTHDFGTWVKSWAASYLKGTAHGIMAYWDIGCYRPIDMQSHRLTCERAIQMRFDYPKEVNVTQAIHNMKKTKYIGVVEAYRESICVWKTKLTGKLAPGCDCAKALIAPHETHETHGASHPPIESFSEDILAQIDAITKNDIKLYKATVHRFTDEAHELEAQHNATLLCNWEKMFGWVLDYDYGKA
jgi:hypothetical protein